MKDYINGQFTKRGSRPLKTNEIIHAEDLGDGYSYRLGFIPFDGVSIDLLKDGRVIAWEHNLAIINTELKYVTDFRVFSSIARNRLKEMKLNLG